MRQNLTLVSMKGKGTTRTTLLQSTSHFRHSFLVILLLFIPFHRRQLFIAACIQPLVTPYSLPPVFSYQGLRIHCRLYSAISGSVFIAACIQPSPAPYSLPPVFSHQRLRVHCRLYSAISGSVFIAACIQLSPAPYNCQPVVQ